MDLFFSVKYGNLSNFFKQLPKLMNNQHISRYLGFAGNLFSAFDILHYSCFNPLDKRKIVMYTGVVDFIHSQLFKKDPGTEYAHIQARFMYTMLKRLREVMRFEQPLMPYENSFLQRMLVSFNVKDFTLTPEKPLKFLSYVYLKKHIAWLIALANDPLTMLCNIFPGKPKEPLPLSIRPYCFYALVGARTELSPDSDALSFLSPDAKALLLELRAKPTDKVKAFSETPGVKQCCDAVSFYNSVYIDERFVTSLAY